MFQGILGTGLLAALAAGGGGGDDDMLEHIGTATADGDTTSLGFSAANLLSGYEALLLVWNIVDGDTDDLRLFFNSDTTITNYRSQYTRAGGATVSALNLSSPVIGETEAGRYDTGHAWITVLTASSDRFLPCAVWQSASRVKADVSGVRATSGVLVKTDIEAAVITAIDVDIGGTADALWDGSTLSLFGLKAE